MPRGKRAIGSARRSPKARRGAAPGRERLAAEARRELRAVIAIGVSVLLLLSLHIGATGIVGRGLSRGLGWLLGDTTEVVALGVILFNLRSLLGHRGVALRKRWGLLLLWLALSGGLGFAELLRLRSPGALTVADAFALTKTGVGGGVVGNLLTYGLVRLLDGVGSQVVLWSLALGGLILLTEASTRVAFGRALAGGGRLLWLGVSWFAGVLGALVVGLSRGLVQFFSAEPEAAPPRPKPAPARRERAEEAPRAEGRRSFNFPSFGWSTPGPEAGEKPGARQAERAAEAPGAAVRPEAGGAAGREAERQPEAAEVPEAPAPRIRTYEPPAAGDGPAGGGQVLVHGAQLALLSGEVNYQLPPLSLLSEPVPTRAKPARNLADQGKLLEETLASFGVTAKVVQIDQGPVVTRFELQPAAGVKVSRIVSLADDIALSLAAADVRIEAPIPGKAAVGIEVPNKETSVVHLREILASPEFANPKCRLALALGKDIGGAPVVCDLVDMPHLLIAGATGSGKSVCLNTLITSVLYRTRPDEVKLLMVDPKRVELAGYDGIPHLLAPVVTDPKKAATALKWVVEEMEKRYELFGQSGVRNIEKYNELIKAAAAEVAAMSEPVPEGEPPLEPAKPLPYVIVLIDELADLMMVAAADVEDSICRLAQMARAAGIHLVIATQRPSVDVITGLIKANVPSRIAFAVSSQVDSRTILDMAGAERLLGKGDMLFCPVGAPKPVRVQGAYMNDREVEA
ncbi:MAG: DNA translocase FtsK, partial [Chitinophagales bacterium]